ncbi:MAG TPA: ABC transporter substrate-binding protein [Candidatus Limnocylindria bacterium]|nr:ABC transporter substrate-binding protein [Candidatus Limnocylindria bacterium]
MRIPRLLIALPLILVGCTGPASGGDGSTVELRLGYFPNVTHATAIVGVESGIFQDKLGSGVTLTTQTFNAGGDVVEAIFGGGLDASYVGPNPAINAWAQSEGTAIKIISGATSGGAFLVVSPDITSPDQLAGKKLGSPQLGNTQDVALRAWLNEQGYETDQEGGGDVSILPQANADILTAFSTGDLDGAWVPEPWATRMVEEGGGHVLVDERDLWPDGEFVTTHLIVATEFLDAHPDVVKRLLEGQVAANAFVNDNPDEAQQAVGDSIGALTGAELDPAILAAAWENLVFTDDPIASSLAESASHAVDVGLLEPVDLDGIYDLSPLNEVLSAQGLEEIPQP